MSGRAGAFADGKWAVEAVALRLLEWGFVVSAPELFHAGESGRGRNAPDIRVWSRNYADPGNRIIEVKGLSAQFTAPEDWPFPDVIVDREDTFLRKERKPFAYVNVSRPTGAMVVLPLYQLENFESATKPDRRSETRRRYIVAPPDALVTVHWLKPALEMGDDE